MTKRPTQQTYAQRATDYARRVVAGKILASKWIKLACQRHLDDLADADSRWKFDDSRVHRICSFASTYRHEKGQLQGQRLILRDWQIFILASIFGWVDEDGTRKHREVLILVPRGQGKSPLAAIIGVYMAFADGEPGAEVYTAATTEKQSLEVFRPARAFIEQEPAFAHIGVEAAAKSIFCTATRSRFTPVIGRAKYGGAPYCAIMDEAHQFPDTELYDSFKTGCNKRKNSLLVTISTAGVLSADNPCYQLQQDAQQVLEGTIPNDRLLAIIHCADPEVDWTSLEALQQANPNLGISNDLEALRLDQAEATRNPAKQNVFKAMHLNQWSTAAASWMNMQAWDACLDPELTEAPVKDSDCWLGSDLASKLDLSCTVRLYRKDIDGKPHYYVLTRAYLPEARVNLPENQHYQKWAKQGHLTVTSGSAIDYATLEADTLADIAANRVQSLCFDARYADQYSQRVSETSGIVRIEVPPSPAVLSPAMKELEAAIYDGRLHHDGHPVLKWCISNLLTRESGLGNYSMPYKAGPEKKIDCAIALLIAMTQARLMPVSHTSTWSFEPFVI